MTNLTFIYSTFPNQEEALKMAEDLVNRKLAACINVMQSHTAVYRWEGQVGAEEEVAVLIKTLPEKVEAVKAEILRLHSYDVPAILVLPTQSEQTYFQWVQDELTS